MTKAAVRFALITSRDFPVEKASGSSSSPVPPFATGLAALINFEQDFMNLTDRQPFSWQVRFFRSLEHGQIPTRCVIPTGLGKTSLLAIWLIAKARGLSVPNRLVYVVNRRTVVDQTTSEAERLRQKCGVLGLPSLAISTLRGQFADNQEWMIDPSRPSIICGTVDMIGSRLLFGGYRIGFRARPLHAAYLGQDAWLIHDEAHLEPAFQRLLEIVAQVQRTDANRSQLPWSPLRITALSATARAGFTAADQAPSSIFQLTAEELSPPPDSSPTNSPEQIAWQRLSASKQMTVQELATEKEVASAIADRLLAKRDRGERLIAFVQSPDTVKKICEKICQGKSGYGPEEVRPLTGTMRGHERDLFVTADPVFARFRPGQQPQPESRSVVLVCTSAGEVGVDISADHLFSDLSTFDSMAQRFGRVNRYGEYAADIEVFYGIDSLEKKKDKEVDDPRTAARSATLALLKQMGSDVSPIAIGRLDEEERLRAFAPEPKYLPITESLLDAWAMTSIRRKMPGRPDLEKYLHGDQEYTPPMTQVAWREEVERLAIDQWEPEDCQQLLNDFPIHPREVLTDQTERVFNELETLARKAPDTVAWLVDEYDQIRFQTLAQITGPGEKGPQRKRRISALENMLVLLPPSIGGLRDGLLDGSSEPPVLDQSCGGEQPGRCRIVVSGDQTPPILKQRRLIRIIELNDSDDSLWCWYADVVGEAGRTAEKPVLLDDHVSDVIAQAEGLSRRLGLPPQLATVVQLAAKFHDLGKNREVFQRSLGNNEFPRVLLAKSGVKGIRIQERFRHELASMIDAANMKEIQQLDGESQSLVLHLIAAHHGRGRPHFASDEAFDPQTPAEVTNIHLCATPHRFATLQAKFGRWGLAYIESLLRTADWSASANPTIRVKSPENSP